MFNAPVHLLRRFILLDRLQPLHLQFICRQLAFFELLDRLDRRRRLDHRRPFYRKRMFVLRYAVLSIKNLVAKIPNPNAVSTDADQLLLHKIRSA